MQGTPENDVVGQRIGSWQVEALIAEGGMGRVYRARSSDGQEAALKLVKSDLAHDAVFRKRFEREASIAERVEHPHVVPVLDSGEHDGTPYLAQRLIRGGSLDDRLEREGALDIDFALRVCSEVASGLDALHATGLFHRDVKPANILLDEDETAYITDFGLAKDSQGSLLTRPGQTLGSLDYMAPEQIRGEEVSAATRRLRARLRDVRVPDRHAAVRRPPGHARRCGPISRTSRRIATEARPDLPQAFASELRRALAKDPADRPASASGPRRGAHVGARQP